MQEFHSKKGRNGGTGRLKLVEVTGVSFQMGKVMAVRARIGAERVSFHKWEVDGSTCQKEAGVEKRRPLMT